MAINCYLAMTAAEIGVTDPLPEHIGWLACHFSSYSTGLSNLPRQLPAGSMIIINDRVPLHKHDPQHILEQAQQLYECLSPACFLLDLQRPEEPLAEEIATVLQKLPCPVGVTQFYGKDLPCPVFLPPPPLYVSLEEHLQVWQGRPVWLEAAIEAATITVDSNGCTLSAAEVLPLAEPSFEEESLHFLYHTRLPEQAVQFDLLRDQHCLQKFLNHAEALGVTLAAGLYQQYKNSP